MRWFMDSSLHHLPITVPKSKVKVASNLLAGWLTAPVLHEPAYVQELDTAVARGEQAAFKPRRADTQALPRLLDAEGSLGLAPIELPKYLPRWRAANVRLQ